LQQLHFETTIKATQERVWEMLWHKFAYPIWTAPFAPDCFFTSDWLLGSSIHFMGSNGNGIYGVIEKLIEGEQVSFKHLGIIQNNEPQLSEAPWQDLYETYTLLKTNEAIVLKVELSCIEDYQTFFIDHFPKALDIIKNMAEHKIYIPITISTVITAPIEKVWMYFITPSHIIQWNNASDDWHTTAAEVDLKIDGKFSAIMAAKDGSISFDFWGIYTKIIHNTLLEYKLGDGRNVTTQFIRNDTTVTIKQTFDAENENSIILQEGGWQAILNNFKKHTEHQ
jgi:uncharacterized protein YndB with AHSA1/START domain